MYEHVPNHQPHHYPKKAPTLPTQPASTIMQAPISQPCSGRSFGMKMYPLLQPEVGRCPSWPS